MADFRLRWWCVEVRCDEVKRIFWNLNYTNQLVSTRCNLSTSNMLVPTSTVYECVTCGNGQAFLCTSTISHVLHCTYHIDKDKQGDKSDQDSYSGTEVSSGMPMAFQLAMFQKVSSCMEPCEQQLGFRHKQSCSDCLYVLKKSVKFYLSNGSKEVLLVL